MQWYFGNILQYLGANRVVSETKIVVFLKKKKKQQVNFRQIQWYLGQMQLYLGKIQFYFVEIQYNLGKIYWYFWQIHCYLGQLQWYSGKYSGIWDKYSGWVINGLPVQLADPVKSTNKKIPQWQPSQMSTFCDFTLLLNCHAPGLLILDMTEQNCDEISPGYGKETQSQIASLLCDIVLKITLYQIGLDRTRGKLVLLCIELLSKHTHSF